MIVSELWRFPVKSIGGERITDCRVAERGLEGDRQWGVRDNRTGRILSAKKEGRLLLATARCVAEGRVVVTLPDGRETDSDSDLAAWLDMDVSLVSAGDEAGTFDCPIDFENETDWITFNGPIGSFHDSARTQVSLVSTTTLGSWDTRRFRSNVVLEGEGEDELVGRTITLGSVALAVQKQIERCIMVTRPQPGLERDLDVLREINAKRSTFLAIGALVDRGGTVAVGDRLQ